MEKEFLTFIIIGDENNDLNGECYKYYDNGNEQHIDALFKTYEYFKKNNYYITPCEPFRSITSFVEMTVSNGNVVYINMFNHEGLLFMPDTLTDKQNSTLINELNKLENTDIKVSINMNEFNDFNADILKKGKSL